MQSRASKPSPAGAHIQAQANVKAVMRYYEGPGEGGELAVLGEVYRPGFVGLVSGVSEHWTECDNLGLVGALGPVRAGT